MAEKCYCHYNGYQVKDATARKLAEAHEKALCWHYEATPETIAEVIAAANPGSVVQLAAGEYGLLTLNGAESFPENLTIIGGDAVVMAGISITSGAENNKLWDSDISSATLPGGLTIRGIELTEAFSLRNAYIDGLKIIDCHITRGGINITPNAYKDKYGKDGTGSTANRFSFQGATVKNLFVMGCTIDNVSTDNNNTNHAIYIQTGENITIQNNTITAAVGNGIQIVAMEDRTVTGNIRICDNKILKSKENAIRIDGPKDAVLFVVNNKLTQCQLSGLVDKYIRVTNTTNTFCKFKRRDLDGHNYHDDLKLDVDNGISVESAKTYETVVAEGKSDVWNWRKLKNGVAELWGNVVLPRMSSNDFYKIASLPFPVNNMCVNMTLRLDDYFLDVNLFYDVVSNSVVDLNATSFDTSEGGVPADFNEVIVSVRIVGNWE